jgi:hypothetical protein
LRVHIEICFTGPPNHRNEVKSKILADISQLLMTPSLNNTTHFPGFYTAAAARQILAKMALGIHEAPGFPA